MTLDAEKLKEHIKTYDYIIVFKNIMQATKKVLKNPCNK